MARLAANISRMRAAAALLMLALSPAAGAAGEREPAGCLPKPLFSRIDFLARQAMQRGRTPGFSIAVVCGGRVAFAKGYGLRNLHFRQAAQADTRYDIGSLTKQFTAVLILQLVAEKRVSLNTRIGDILPEFTGIPIRIHNLLAQTSGVPDYNSAAFIIRSFPAEIPGHAQPQSVVAHLATLPLHFSPGTQFEYSNSDYFLLGIIAQRLTQQPYEELLRRRIFGPLGMHRSGVDTGRGLNEAQGYTATDVGLVPVPQFDPKLSFAAGGIRSSARDLAMWASALLHDPRFHPYFAQMTTRVRLGNHQSPYGEGFFVDAQGAQTVAWHDGTVAGFKSMEILSRPDNRAIIVLANADTAPAPELAVQIRALMVQGTGTQPLSQLNAGPSWWSRALLATVAALFFAIVLISVLRRRRVRRQ